MPWLWRDVSWNLLWTSKKPHKRRSTWLWRTCGQLEKQGMRRRWRRQRRKSERRRRKWKRRRRRSRRPRRRSKRWRRWKPSRGRPFAAQLQCCHGSPERCKKMDENYFTYLHILWFKQFRFFSEYPHYASKDEWTSNHMVNKRIARRIERTRESITLNRLKWLKTTS